MRLRRFPSGRTLCVAAAVFAALALVALPGVPARATYAGQNGRIAVVANRTGTWQLYTMNPDGTGMLQITNLPPTEYVSWLPDFSPDGRRIVFCHDMTGDVELYVINADGIGLIRLTNDARRVDCAPRWSPDATRIVFARESPRTHQFVITTMRANGTGKMTALASGFRPEYTPDGTQIVFESDIGGFVSALWIMNADGSNQRRLTPPELEAGGPDVSPDGHRIAFINHENTELPNAIYTMNLDGSGITQLTPPGSSHDVQPAYSPDGTKIVFMSDRSLTGDMDAFVMSADGSGITGIATDLTLGGCPDDNNCVNPDWGAKP